MLSEGIGTSGRRRRRGERLCRIRSDRICGFSGETGTTAGVGQTKQKDSAHLAVVLPKRFFKSIRSPVRDQSLITINGDRYTAIPQEKPTFHLNLERS